jgi:hypothetical protein
MPRSEERCYVTRYAYALLFCTATTLRAQTPTIQPRFALEIQRPAGFAPRFLIIQEGQGVQRTLLSFGPSLPRLDGRESLNNISSQRSAVELEYKMNGDMVEITASVVFGPLDERGPNGSLEGRSTQSIGTYSARLAESIVLDKMEDLGLQPWTITVVTAQLPHPTSLGNVSRVPSIQVEILGEDRAGYKVSLHNLSSQGVTAFMVANSFHDANTRFGERSGRGPVIPAGASHEFHFGCDSSEPPISRCDRFPRLLMINGFINIYPTSPGSDRELLPSRRPPGSWPDRSIQARLAILILQGSSRMVPRRFLPILCCGDSNFLNRRPSDQNPARE